MHEFFDIEEKSGRTTVSPLSTIEPDEEPFSVFSSFSMLWLHSTTKTWTWRSWKERFPPKFQKLWVDPFCKRINVLCLFSICIFNYFGLLFSSTEDQVFQQLPSICAWCSCSLWQWWIKLAISGSQIQRKWFMQVTCLGILFLHSLSICKVR